VRVFIAGGTGFVGGHLCSELRKRGHEITLLAHSRKGPALDGCRIVEGDVTNADEYYREINGCDAVINLVGIIREFPVNGVTFEKLHVAATQAMITATHKAGVERYIQMSALGTRPNAVSRYHQTKWRAEELVRASDLAWTIFRPSVIFGPGDAFISMLAGYVLRYPAVPVIGDGMYRLQPIAAVDVGRCFAMALEMRETIGKTYELCGPDRLTYIELLDAIGTVLGKSSVLKLKNPVGLLKLVTPLLQGFSFFPLSMDQIQMLLEENICNGDWRATFDFDAQHFAAGISSYLRKT